MSALVNNLLDMARIESGEVKLRRQWQPFEEVVGSALKAAQAGARATIASRSTLARDLPLVEFDATLIERVLYNLLENAGKYTPPERVDHRRRRSRRTASSWSASATRGRAFRRARKSRSSRSSRAARANRPRPASVSASRSAARSSRRITERSAAREQSGRRRALHVHAAAGHAARDPGRSAACNVRRQ